MPDLFGHGPQTPMRGCDSVLFNGLLDDRELGGAERLVAGRLGTTFGSSLRRPLRQTIPASARPWSSTPDLAPDRYDAVAFPCHENDPRPLRDLLRLVSIGEQTLQFLASLAVNDDPSLIVSHPMNEPRMRQNVIQMFVTEH